MNRRRALNLVLIAVVVGGYGIPLTYGYLVAREARADSAALEALFDAQIATETSSQTTRMWLIRYVTLLPRERAHAAVLRHTRDPRPSVRYVAADWLLRYFPEMPGSIEAATAYMNDPREVALLRLSIFEVFPEWKTSPATQDGWESLRLQLGLFGGAERLIPRIIYYNVIDPDELKE